MEPELLKVLAHVLLLVGMLIKEQGHKVLKVLSKREVMNHV